MVFMLLWKVCAGVRETDLPEDGGCLCVCSCAVVWEGCTSRLWSQGFRDKHARFCASTPPFITNILQGLLPKKLDLQDIDITRHSIHFLNITPLTFAQFGLMFKVSQESEKRLLTCIPGNNQQTCMYACCGPPWWWFWKLIAGFYIHKINVLLHFTHLWCVTTWELSVPMLCFCAFNLVAFSDNILLLCRESCAGILVGETWLTHSNSQSASTLL